MSAAISQTILQTYRGHGFTRIHLRACDAYAAFAGIAVPQWHMTLCSTPIVSRRRRIERASIEATIASLAHRDTFEFQSKPTSHQPARPNRAA